MIELNGFPVEVTIFPDGTSQVWKLPDGLIERQNSITWRFQNEAELIHLTQLYYLIRAQGGSAKLNLPYLPYARQDKEVSNRSTFAFHVFTDMLNLMTFNTVSVFDPHNYAAAKSIDNVEIIYPINEIRYAFNETDSDVVCFPDEGAKERYAEKIQHEGFPFVTASKVRDTSTGQITSINLHGSVYGENVLIVDDLCDGGATFISLANEMHDAKSISLYVSHGIFSKGIEVLRNGGIKRIFTKEGEVK